MDLHTMFSRILAVVFLFVAFTAAAVDLNVSVQPRNLTVGMRGYVEISAENVSRLQLRQSPPRMDGIEWTSGISSGSSMSIINGVTTSRFTLRVPFTARTEGEFTVPALEVVVNGKSYARGQGPNKKKAEQEASRLSLETLKAEAAEADAKKAAAPKVKQPAHHIGLP